VVGEDHNSLRALSYGFTILGTSAMRTKRLDDSERVKWLARAAVTLLVFRQSVNPCALWIPSGISTEDRTV
jgi:hypothetical protein